MELTLMEGMLKKYITIPANPDQIAVLRWVMKARSDDKNRPALIGINFSECEWAATDGFRIHVAKWDRHYESYFPQEGTYAVNGILRGLVILEKIDTKFPEIHSIIDSSLQGGMKPVENAEEYVYRTFLNSKFIVDALDFGVKNKKRLDIKGDEIQIRGHKVPIVIKVNSGNLFMVKMLAVIMPMLADGMGLRGVAK